MAADRSKLAVIDDCVICGSANWTYRSMRYDGEISLFMESTALANYVLWELFKHYNNGSLVNIDNIGMMARTSAEAIIGNCGTATLHQPGKFLLLPLEYKPLKLGPGMCLYAGEAAPSRTWWQHFRHPKESMDGLKKDLPNWTWW